MSLLLILLLLLVLLLFLLLLLPLFLLLPSLQPGSPFCLKLPLLSLLPHGLKPLLQSVSPQNPPPELLFLCA